MYLFCLFSFLIEQIMQITGCLAVLTYIIDGGFKLREFRQKSRDQRLAAVNSDDAKVEEPYVDEEAAAEIPAVQK